MQNKPITITGREIKPGTITQIFLPSAGLYTQTKIDLPAHVFHGRKAGPKLFITGTIHGDELNSIEILRRLHTHSAMKHIHGTLITIPVANVFGLILRSRYLPDRRDLNRSFPGSKTGSLAARLADVLIEEIVRQCNYGIDLHTGSVSRTNLPQLRVNLETPGAEDLAKIFDVPVIINAKLRDGSLREAAAQLGIPLLVYEGGEALRYNELFIRMGVRGILNVLSHLGMIKKTFLKKSKKYEPVITETSSWVRSPVSGLMQSVENLSGPVKKDDILAYIHDPFLMNESVAVKSPFDGIIIGKTNLPLVNEGDAIYHIATFEEKKEMKEVTHHIDELLEEISEDGDEEGDD